jgi:hypothetical protein
LIPLFQAEILLDALDQPFAQLFSQSVHRQDRHAISKPDFQVTALPRLYNTTLVDKPSAELGAGHRPEYSTDLLHWSSAANVLPFAFCQPPPACCALDAAATTDQLVVIYQAHGSPCLNLLVFSSLWPRASRLPTAATSHYWLLSFLVPIR